MKKGFTLIELLVVIAIIAILAAILFPVFAQAKAAAKAASALSNTKQLNLGQIMYQGDYDDTFSPGTQWNTGSDPLCFGAGVCFSTWAWIGAPYVKNAQILADPSAGSNTNYFGWSAELNSTVFPQFGYNYTFLAPFSGSGATFQITPATSTAAADPANTVMITSKWIHSDQPGWSGGTLWGTGPFPGGSMADADSEGVVCGPLLQNCFSDWGRGGGWDAGGAIGGTTGVPETEGKYTAGNAFRVSNQVTVAWVDGHAKRVTYNALALGTNFNYNAAAGSPGSNGAITTVHAAQYPWSITKDCSQWGSSSEGCSL
jgi:prepilin-type N-terminal cleavage/methylation domain-containing protein/prepilin-type processing-associated H-X9-DG protein